MSEDERLATLAVAFARDLAPALLSRLATPTAADARRHADRLAAASRHDRIVGVALALEPDTGAVRARAAAAALVERPRLARLLVAYGAGHPTDGACTAALARLCRERVGR